MKKENKQNQYYERINRDLGNVCEGLGLVEEIDGNFYFPVKITKRQKITPENEKIRIEGLGKDITTEDEVYSTEREDIRLSRKEGLVGKIKERKTISRLNKESGDFYNDIYGKNEYLNQLK
jgi:hypothetical protein